MTRAFTPISRFNRTSDDPVVAAYRICATLDFNTRLRCAALDGREFQNGAGPRPPFHRNCRCVAVPISRSWKDLGIDLPEMLVGTRASMFGQVPGEWRYFDWLARQHEGDIERVLGRQLGRVFIAGGLTPQQFADALLGPRFGLKSIQDLRREYPEVFRRAGMG